jgi:hypothetical protein
MGYYISISSYVTDAKTSEELEAVADEKLWILHLLLGMAGSHNDIKCWSVSFCFPGLLKGNLLP